MISEPLRSTFGALDEWIEGQIAEAHREGYIAPKTPVRLRIVGQLALLLSALDLPVAGTTDLDAIGTLEYPVQQQLQCLLRPLGLQLEPDQHLIWMPPDTIYRKWYDGLHVHVRVAAPRYVIASKCRFHRERDRRLVLEFFSRYPDDRFQIERMGIDLRWLAP